jgi:hypothetical protein
MSSKRRSGSEILQGRLDLLPVVIEHAQTRIQVAIEMDDVVVPSSTQIIMFFRVLNACSKLPLNLESGCVITSCGSPYRSKMV